MRAEFINLYLEPALLTRIASESVDAEHMATALSAHLLRRYSTKQQVIRDYTGGLPKYKLKEAIAYINAHQVKAELCTTQTRFRTQPDRPRYSIRSHQTCEQLFHLA